MAHLNGVLPRTKKNIFVKNAILIVITEGILKLFFNGIKFGK